MATGLRGQGAVQRPTHSLPTRQRPPGPASLSVRSITGTAALAALIGLVYETPRYRGVRFRVFVGYHGLILLTSAVWGLLKRGAGGPPFFCLDSRCLFKDDMKRRF
jgi:hypothetical protein